MLLRRLPRLRDRTCRPRGRVRRHVPHQRDHDRSSTRPSRRRRRQHPRSPARRDLLPLAHRPVDPRAGAAGVRARTRSRSSVCRCLIDSSPMRIRMPRAQHCSRRPCAHSTRCSPSPIADCVYEAPDGSPCIEARTTADLEDSLAMTGGDIFHGALSWPWADDDEPLDSPAARWGVATAHPGGAAVRIGSATRRCGQRPRRAQRRDGRARAAARLTAIGDQAAAAAGAAAGSPRSPAGPEGRPRRGGSRRDRLRRTADDVGSRRGEARVVGAPVGRAVGHDRQRRRAVDVRRPGQQLGRLGCGVRA